MLCFFDRQRLKSRNWNIDLQPPNLDPIIQKLEAQVCEDVEQAVIRDRLHYLNCPPAERILVRTRLARHSHIHMQIHRSLPAEHLVRSTCFERHIYIYTYIHTYIHRFLRSELLLRSLCLAGNTIRKSRPFFSASLWLRRPSMSLLQPLPWVEEVCIYIYIYIYIYIHIYIP